MCILSLAWAAHPRWQLVLAGNRDEFHDRPAGPLAPWDDVPGLIAGRDLRSGGTWLGVSTEGRCAIVTNRRGFGGPAPDKASRGALVTDLLAGTGRYADPDRATLEDFNPFNLILVDREGARLLANRPHVIRAALTPGLYGLSNGALDEPWPKTLQLKAAMLDWLTHDADDPAALFAALRTETLPAAGIVPEMPSDIPDEAAASPVFIRHPVYGTRCSTVVAVDTEGHGTVIERRFNPDGTQSGEDSIAFSWPPAR